MSLKCPPIHIPVQVSTTVETFQDLSLPIPGKEDLAKLHSSIHQNLPAKAQGSCPDSYGSQGWIPFIMDSIRRSAGGRQVPGTTQGIQTIEHGLN